MVEHQHWQLCNAIKYVTLAVGFNSDCLFYFQIVESLIVFLNMMQLRVSSKKQAKIKLAAENG